MGLGQELAAVAARGRNRESPGNSRSWPRWRRRAGTGRAQRLPAAGECVSSKAPLSLVDCGSFSLPALRESDANGSGALYDRVPQDADALDLRLHYVARLQVERCRV